MPLAARNIIEIKGPADSLPEERKVFMATQEHFRRENLMLRLWHVFQPQKVPVPEVMAQFRNEGLSACTTNVKGDKQADGGDILPERTIDNYWNVMWKNEPPAGQLQKAGFTPCLLKQAQNAITRHRETIMVRRARPTLQARWDYVTGKASL